MLRNMVTRRFGGLVVCFHTARDPSDDEWREYVEAIRAVGGHTVRNFVCTDGGGPNAKQRKAALDAGGGDRGKVAVVSGNVVVRGVVTAFAWFGVTIAAFEPKRVEDALTFVRATQDERELIARFARETERDLGWLPEAGRALV